MVTRVRYPPQEFRELFSKLRTYREARPIGHTFDWSKFRPARTPSFIRLHERASQARQKYEECLRNIERQRKQCYDEYMRALNICREETAESLRRAYT